MAVFSGVAGSIAGTGEMADRIRAFDWSSTPLGPIPLWPNSLLTAVNICINSRFPMVIWWGRDLILLYNDAWRPILGAAKHPRALGSPGREIWPEIWDIIGPQLNGVLQTGRATWSDDMLLVLERNYYTEEAYFTYSYSPVYLEDGAVGGTFTFVSETTARVLGERRWETLRRLGARVLEAKNAEDACSRSAQTLQDNSADIPFALIYLLDHEGNTARLVESVRLPPGTPASPTMMTLSGGPEPPWPIAEVASTGEPKRIDDLLTRFPPLPGGQWPAPPSRAIALPLAAPGTKQLAGIAIIGISSYRELDKDYSSFLDLTAGHIATAIANAHAYEQERRRAERIGAPRTGASTAIRPEAYADEALHWLPEQPELPLPTDAQPEGTVFIAEVNSDMRDYLRRLLGQRYRVDAFADGAAALQRMQTNPPDLLLTDVMMPGLDGFELLKIIRADEKLREVPVILLSARAGEDAKIEGLEAGADDYLVKPFTAGELLARVRSNLQMARARKNAERSLREAQKLESIGLLAGGVAHEFNNLLVGVLGNASLILDDLRPDNPHYALAEDIVRASQAAANLTGQLLAYAGKGQVLARRLDLNTLIREIRRLLQVSIPKEVELKLNLDPDLPAVDADATQMQQLIMNLVFNGAEAIGEHQAGTVAITTSARSGQVMIEVTDTGSGMNEEVIARIFDPFFTTKFTGRGLGLAAVQGIVRAHHGSIQVKSAPGSGTTFLIGLPAVERDSEQRMPEAVKQPNLRGSGTILVVDNEKGVRNVVQAILERQGYEVLLAENGMSAIDIARREDRISAVVLDWAMPVMNGEETLRRLKSIRPDVPVIASSGYNQSEAEKNFGGGLAGFVQKPYKPSDLTEAIKQVLRISPPA